MDMLFELLIANGCVISTKEYKLIKRLLEKSLDDIIVDIEKTVYKYLDIDDFGVNNLSIGIKIEDFEFIFEKPSNCKNRLYDIASITKLITLKYCYDLQEKGLIDFNRLASDYLDFPNLKKCKIIDILKMKNKIETCGKLSSAKNESDFLKILYTVNYTITNKKVYTDVGFVLLGKILENIYNQEHNVYKKYSFIINEYLNKQLKLKNTMYNPGNEYKLVGNGNNKMLPHDPKTKINGGFTGAAGLFSNSADFIIISEKLFEYKFFSKKFFDKILNYNFLDENNRRRSYAGLYLKTLNNKSSYVPDLFSKYSIAHQGYTGSIVVFDLFTKIHFSILVDAIDKKTNVKSENFFKYMHELKNKIALFCMVIYLSKQKEKM